MATNKLNLPMVLIQDNDFRIVAVEETKQGQSDHGEHIVVNIGSDESPCNVKCVAETVARDSLGGESWSTYGFNDAARHLLRTTIQGELQQRSPIVNQQRDTAPEKKKKLPVVE